MNISSSIAFEAPLVSYAETARVARRAAAVKQNVWSMACADSAIVNVAGAAVLAMTGLVSLAAFAHVFPGRYQSA